MTNIIQFRFNAQEVRTIADDKGEPWFAAADVCTVLGYRNTSDAIAKHCREKGIAKRDTPTSSGIQAMTFINEGNLYRLIIKSRKEEAQRFESWVCDEVLPAIRKHGQYTDSKNKMATLVGETIGTNGFNMLGGLIKGKVVRLPVEARRRATAKLWSQTHAAFGVRSAADIPADQLDAARNFIAAYALDGEWLPKEEPAMVSAMLNSAQAKEVVDRLNRLGQLFHPFSEPFADVLGIGRVLRGLHPKIGMHKPEYQQVIPRL